MKTKNTNKVIEKISHRFGTWFIEGRPEKFEIEKREFWQFMEYLNSLKNEKE